VTNTNFAAAIEKIAKAPPEKVFESAMQMLKEVQQMDEESVVAFWRAVRVFWEHSPGRNTEPQGIVRHLLETAWSRMRYLQAFDMSEEPLVYIEDVFAAHQQKASPKNKAA
jgi:hypothetical protein